MIVQFQFRRATSAEWSAANPVLAGGEPGYDSTTDSFKIGDGNRSWNQLPYQTISAATMTALIGQIEDAVADSTAGVQAVEDAVNAANIATQNAEAAIASFDPTAAGLIADTGSQTYAAIGALRVVAHYTTPTRPTTDLYSGKMIWDDTLGKPIWYSGTAWKDATGATV